MTKQKKRGVRLNKAREGDRNPAFMRILIVEDDPVNHELLERILRHFGFESLSAQNGLQAIQCLQEGAKIDFILMDAVMPVCDGLTATREIRKNFAHPILGISAQASIEADFLQAGADGVLIKPFTCHGLLDKIREISPTITPESLLQ